jgi:DNA-binding PadR family transcriptional regulator
MNRYTLTDKMVWRVLQSLSATNDRYGHKSLKEVTVIYNRLYPPNLIGKIIGIKVEERAILPILNFLEAEKLVRWEIFSIWLEPLETPTRYYALTNEGTQYLSKRKAR